MTTHSRSRSSVRAALMAALCGATVLAGPATAQDAAELGLPDSDYSLDKLIEAARKEGPIVVVDATGKIVQMAERFTQTYGVQATGVKLAGQEQEQVILREAAAGNVRSDVFNMSNLPSVTSQILPEGAGTSWMPPDLKEAVPAQYQNPAITSLNPWVWAYNSDVHKDGCPIDNVWALTEEAWRGKIAMPDPLLRNETMFWFNQMEAHGDDAMRAAYEAHFGTPLETDEASATAEWVKRLAANKPNVTRSDSDVGPIVGAAGQAEPPMGFLSAAIFRDARQDGYGMAICDGLKPWIGQLTPRVAVIATGTKHPNAAKLFVHYMMTGEGMAPQLIDGKLSSNRNATMPAEEASGIADKVDQLFVPHSETSDSDFSTLQDWQDFWIVSKR
ncbi:ABC transporter substrate-binding protein [Aureimonas frigidaquae]|uniref:ABC superfamily ATP binding cassette transporter periplasmic substrate-binding protein n=1 Tax=Aureimonas frigidaquae TaxID=424757 RepID=A0A0P0Z3G0_9HYPH|nr:ABC transporter substrate-binding protein [Aureimonas frigidaquae]BAT28556.1 ABC superfamily ATP binding cassette transporter periplasmic substrate-binding protein [Aureimonas frigidaquae]